MGGTIGSPPINNKKSLLNHILGLKVLLGGAGIIPGTMGGIPGIMTGGTPGNRPGGPAGNKPSPTGTGPTPARPSVLGLLVSGPSSVLAEPVYEWKEKE